jgi:hypothetical protein
VLPGGHVALATPVCLGQDRTLCGGRIIPEAAQSAGFLTYAEWTGAMQELAREHPDRVRFHQIGVTAGGRPLYDVMVSDFSAPAPLSQRTGLYLNGDIHGDERDGTEGFARVVEDLAESHDSAVREKLSHEVLVFTDANPDGWITGDVPGGVGQQGPSGPQYTRYNAANHDLNREWPVVGFQNPTTFPLVDPEVRSIVNAHGNALHRRDGLHFAYGLDVHGSATVETPPNAQLMLDVLLSAGELDLTRSLEQTQLFSTYMSNLSATTNDNALATVGGASGQQVYRVGEWDTSWDIYGYLVSGGFADWMANEVTGLGAVTGTVELWINGEPGQENTFAGYNQQVEASNVHSMRVAVATLMQLGALHQRGILHLPGPVAYVPNRYSLQAGQGAGSTAPVGSPQTNPPGRPYPVATNRFWEDLASQTDQPLTALTSSQASEPAALARERAVAVTGDPHLDDPAFLSALKAYAQQGGTVILTDGALRALAGMGIVPAGAVAMQKQYAGYFDIADPSSPLVRGARPLSRQTYEPVPVGYKIDNTFSSATSTDTAPVWSVDQNAWQAAGGSTVGTTGSGRTSLGELRLGRGRVRILGAVLPDPTGDFAHPFGVADYSVTYWGYRVLANLLAGTEALVGAGTSAAGPSPGSGSGPARATPIACLSRRIFTVHVPLRRGERLKTVSITINGRRAHVLRRSAAGVVIDLRTRPRGHYRVVVQGRTRAGRPIHLLRRYRTCTPGRRGRRSPRMR